VGGAVSLDFYLDEGACPTPCAHCEYRVAGVEVWCANITHNCSGMWSAAGCYEALYESEGKRAFEIVEVVRSALRWMAAHPSECRAREAKNGWGTFEQALPWLRRLLRALEEYPDAVIRVSR